MRMPPENRDSFLTELLKFILVAVVIVVPVRLFVAQPFIVDGASSVPTFETGQYLIIDELTYHFEQPQRYDFIVMRYPKDPSQFFIKRIIGLPGETVAIRSGNIYIESSGTTTELTEPYVVNHGNGEDMTVTLTSDQYWVMGDNRPESSDSRTWGPLPREDIVGHVILRLLPIQTFGLFPGSYTPPQSQ
jgi:signal peptidase I